MKLRELPKDERPREKILQKGVESLSNAELMAIFIDTGTQDKSAIEIGEEVISLDKSGLSFLTNCSIEDFSKIKGVGIAKACKIKAAVELGRRIATSPKPDRSYITSAEDVSNLFMERMRYYEKEHFNILLLNSKGEIIDEKNISIGDIASSIVHPRETFIWAVRRSAAAIILVHNHPSGNPEPSQEDINVTNRLIEAGTIMGIKVLDHIVIGDGNYVSMKSEGLIS